MDLCTDIYEEISSGAEMYRLMGKCGNITEVFEETFKTGNQKRKKKHITFIKRYRLSVMILKWKNW